jgi:hypothetical protein
MERRIVSPAADFTGPVVARLMRRFGSFARKTRMSSEVLDGQQRPETGDGATMQQPCNDIISWQNSSADRPVGRAARVAVAEPVAVMRRKQSAPAAAPLPAAGKKPFGMSYDGSSTADYIRYRISRGAR